MRCLTFSKLPLAVVILSVPHNILKKLLDLGGKDLDELSLDTVRMFHQDAIAAGFKI